ncbi:MAG: hypothetical protein AUK31_07790 [Fibrobacteres bacterium CG2_30_45_31]|nr:MAG: hypothetical protein AUK31_07790 [Fibrobacteres bacterium CG2_30_45_31]
MKINCILVTYNRIEKLKKALASYEMQNIQTMIVVNNASTDGTFEFLETWQKESKKENRIVMNLAENSGGAGGFYKGIQQALALDADWIWVADDDAYLQSDTLKILTDFIQKQEFPERISAVCSKVLNANKEISLPHRRKLTYSAYIVHEINVPEENYLKPYFSLDLSSFVGSLINVDAIKKVGFPEKDYFIWYDDTEYFMRLRKVGSIFCVPTAVVLHDAPKGSSEVSWKTYYGFRNQLLSYRRNFGYLCLFRHSYRLWKKANRSAIIRKKVMRAAIRDAILGKKGVHPIFKPGWKPQS